MELFDWIHWVISDRPWLFFGTVGLLAFVGGSFLKKGVNEDTFRPNGL